MRKAGKTSADKVLKMAAGTIPKDEAVNPGDQQLIGEVIRPLRSGDNVCLCDPCSLICVNPTS